MSPFLDGEMSSDVSQWPWANQGWSRTDFGPVECLPGHWTCFAFPTLPEVLHFEDSEARRCVDELTDEQPLRCGKPFRLFVPFKLKLLTFFNFTSNI